MDQTAFVNDSVASFYNSHFISLKIDMEKGEGVDIKQKYRVSSFPTYLFIDDKGTVVHRSSGLMPSNEFLDEGRKASGSNSFSNLKKRYDDGERSNNFLFNYAVSLKKIDRAGYDQVRTELIDQVDENDLRSPFGWQVIDEMAVAENDKLGRFLIANQDFFSSIAGTEKVDEVCNRLKIYEIYQLIRKGDDSLFFIKLYALKNLHSDSSVLKIAVRLKCEYYLANNQELFPETAGDALAGLFFNDDHSLSFIAKKANYMAPDNRRVLNVALNMARRAVDLNPEDYENQAVLGELCYSLKRKSEGLVAAKKARELADASTSKIQKLAQDLIERIEKL